LVDKEEVMPFTVKIVREQAELDKAVQIRHTAYARHVPELAKLLREAEAGDYDEGSVVLLAESKLDGAPLGTMRIQTNRDHQLALEGSVKLPEWIQGASAAEATRLGISEGGIGRVVKTALFKAFYLYCLSESIEWIVICARSPIDRQYEALLFQDVLPERAFVPMQHIGGIPHRVLALDVEAAKERWTRAGHPLLNFFCNTRHPDILVPKVRESKRPDEERSASWFAPTEQAFA
jgi:hypothetical protein